VYVHQHLVGAASGQAGLRRDPRRRVLREGAGRPVKLIQTGSPNLRHQLSAHTHVPQAPGSLKTAACRHEPRHRLRLDGPGSPWQKDGSDWLQLDAVDGTKRDIDQCPSAAATTV